MKIWQSALACGALALGAVAGAHPAQAQGTQFPDVPTNHWAYQAVTDLANEGYVKGYPDGKFLGGRALTRYEFATVIDRIVQTVNDLSTKVGTLTTPTGTPVTQDDLNKIQALVDNFQTELAAIQSQVGTLNDELDSLRQDVLDTKAIANKAQATADAAYSSNPKAKYTISGYIQGRYAATGSGNNLYFPRGTPFSNGAYNGDYDSRNNSQSFTIRRSRLKVAGAPTSNVKFGIQLDASGALNSTNQQVTIREGYVSYTPGTGNSALYPTFTAGQFYDPFGYELPLSSSVTLSPERPLGFNEGGAGIWSNEDYVKGVQVAYNTPSQLLFLPSGLKLSYSAVNPNGRATDNTTRHIDSIYRIGYQSKNKVIGLGVSYYDGEVPNTPAGAVAPVTTTIFSNGGPGLPVAGTPIGTTTTTGTAAIPQRDPKKQLFGIDGQLQLPVGFFVNAEFEKGKFEQRSYFTGATATAGPGFVTDPYVKNNQISAYYVQGGWTFNQTGNHALTVAASYDALYRSHSAQNNSGNLYSSSGGGYTSGGASYDDTNLGYGILYNLDKATRLRVWYEQPFQVAHAANSPVPQRIGLFTTELQVKF